MEDKLNELLSQSILSLLNDKGYKEFEAGKDLESDNEHEITSYQSLKESTIDVNDDADSRI